MNQYPYIATYQPPFPAIDIVLHNSDTQLHTAKLKALLDTGADGTLIPLTYYRLNISLNGPALLTTLR